MNQITRTALLLAPLMLVACGKKEPEPAPAPAVVVAPPAAAPVAAAPVEPAEQTPEQRELADKQAKLAFGMMEDKYMNDPRAQWATSATATSTFGDPKPSDSNLPANTIGPVDGKHWTSGKYDIGFDSLELGYEKPVAATEVRVALEGTEAVEAISKVELQAEDGKWNEIWSGISDVKREQHGPRTWFVRSFAKTAYKVKGVRYTFANNIKHGYKEVNAAQLVGD